MGYLLSLFPLLWLGAQQKCTQAVLLKEYLMKSIIYTEVNEVLYVL